MGNQLGGDPQNAQIYGAALQKIINNPESNRREQNLSSGSKPFTNIRANNISQGDQLPYFGSSPRNQNLSPVRPPVPTNLFMPSNSSVYQNPNQVSNIQVSNVSPVGPNTNFNANQQTNFTPKNKRVQKKQTPGPFNIFSQFFGNDTSEGSQRFRGSSVSHSSLTDGGRKFALLQSNLQVSEKKVQNLQGVLRSSQSKLSQAEQRLNQTQHRLNQTEFKASQAQQNLVKNQQRIQFLQSQLNSTHSQIQNLRNVLGQKQKYLAQSQLQIRTQKNQIFLQQNRLNQASIRQSRKDKQILQLGSAKFELNTLRIRLENNIKIMEDQISDKNEKIKDLDTTIVKKNKQLDAIRQQKMQLQNNITQLRSQFEQKQHKFQQQKALLNLSLKDYLQTINENQVRIEQLNQKVDTYYNNQIENQATIGHLEAIIAETKQNLIIVQQSKSTLQNQVKKSHTQISQLVAKYQSQKIQNMKNKEVRDKTLSDFANAKKLGQKQIEFLQNKLQQLAREREKLIQEIQVTKTVTIQRNKVFQRSIIYQLKHENDRLWSKLIEKSNNETDVEVEDQNFWKNKMQYHKNTLKKTQSEQEKQKNHLTKSKSELEIRFENFIKKLSQNDENGQNSLTRDFSNKSLPKNLIMENAQFYKQRCNQLQKMVQSHIVLNKSLKDQLEKSHSQQLQYQSLSSELSQAQQKNSILVSQNDSLLKQLHSVSDIEKVKTKLEQKIKELEEHNKSLQSGMQVLQKQLQQQRNGGKKGTDQARRLAGQLQVYKKWRGMYEQLKVKYDQMLFSGASGIVSKTANEKDGYKTMYEDLKKQMERLRGLYQHKQKDIQNITSINKQKSANYEHEIKLKESQISSLRQNVQIVQQWLKSSKSQYEQEIRREIAQRQQKYSKLLSHIKQKTTQMKSIIETIKDSYLDEQKRKRIPGLVRQCQLISTDLAMLL